MTESVLAEREFFIRSLNFGRLNSGGRGAVDEMGVHVGDLRRGRCFAETDRMMSLPRPVLRGDFLA